MNLRYAIRMLRKNPGFTVVAALTLALGIGANTAIFSVVYAALLRPLPYGHPERLVTLGEARKQFVDASNSSYPDYLDWVKSAKSFESQAAYSGDAFAMSAGGDPKIVFAGQATPNFFRVKPGDPNVRLRGGIADRSSNGRGLDSGVAGNEGRSDAGAQAGLNHRKPRGSARR